tara:strand:- start:13370 stop:14527 length:1158 start_codon:yes stop_codon:yes gene_type:complete
MKIAEVKKVLFVGELRFTSRNGYFSRQEQLIRQLSKIGDLDIINLGDSALDTKNWLAGEGLKARVASGWLITILRCLFRLWYNGNTIFCNKLRIYKYWKFFPRFRISVFSNCSYSHCIYYYIWPTQMVDVKNIVDQKYVDLGDIMGDRHKRIGVRRWISINPLIEKSIIQSKIFKAIAITPNDSDECLTLYGKRVPVLPYCSHLPTTETNDVNNTNIGYIGAKNNFSDDLVNLLLTGCLIEHLAAKKIMVTLAGGFCSHLSEQQSHDLIKRGVKIMGKVSSVSDFYKQVSVVLNLTGPSTGAKIKSIEALCYGKSLVATEYGADLFTRNYFRDRIFSAMWPLREEQLTQVIIEAFSKQKHINLKEAPEGYLNAVDNHFIDIFSKE